MLRPVVVESTEDEAALVSLGDLDVFGESLDSAAVWSEYWSVLVGLRGVELSASIKGAALSGVPMKVAVRGGGHLVELTSGRLAPGDLFVVDVDEDGVPALEVIPRQSFASIFNGSLVLTFQSKVASMKTAEVTRPLRITWAATDVNEPTNGTANASQFFGPFSMQSTVLQNESVDVYSRQYVAIAIDRVRNNCSKTKLVFENIDFVLPEWSNWVLMHRTRENHSWAISGELRVANSSSIKDLEVMIAPRGIALQPVTLMVKVSLFDVFSGGHVMVQFMHRVKVVFDPRLLRAALNEEVVFEAEYQTLISLPADPAGIVASITKLSNETVWIVDTEVRGTEFNGIRNFTINGRNVTRRARRYSNEITLHLARKDILDGGSVKVAPAEGFSGVISLSFVYIFTEPISMMKMETEIKILLYWLPAPKEVDPVSMNLLGDEIHNITISGSILDELISTVFSDSAYRRDFLLYISSTPLNFSVQHDKSDTYQLVPDNRYFSGFANLTLKAVLQDKKIPPGETSTSHRQFGALPNVTLIVTVDLFIAPVATIPHLNATVVQATPVVGTAMVVSLNKISLQDLDGSEELSVELSTSVRSDVVAVFFNSQLLAPELAAANDADANGTNTTRYALPVPTATLVGIVDAEVILVALDPLFTARFSLSLSATSRELYYTDAAEANATVATAVSTSEVGWMPEPVVYYSRPLDLWVVGQEDTSIAVSLDSIRDRFVADFASDGVGDLSYGPCRLAWDPTRIEAVFVDSARVDPPSFPGVGFGSLAFAKDQSFAFGEAENVSVVPVQGYHGEATVTLSVDTYSSALDQVYVLAANVRVSVVPIAGARSFSSAPNGSAMIYMGFNRELDVAVSESGALSTSNNADAEIVSFRVDANGNEDAVALAQEPPFWMYRLPAAAGEHDMPWVSKGIFVLGEEAGSVSMNNTVTVLPPPDYVGSLPLSLQSVSVTSNLIPSQLAASDAVSDASGEEHAWLTVFSTSIVESLLPTQWNHAQAPAFAVMNTSSRVYEDELGVLWISELALSELDGLAPDVNLSLEVLLPESCSLSVTVNGSLVIPSRNETVDGTSYAVVQLPVESKAVYIAAGLEHWTHVEALLRASVYAFSSSNAMVIPVTLEFLTVAEQPELSVTMESTVISEGGVFHGDITVVPTKAELYYRVQVFYPSGYIAELADRNWTPDAEAGIVFAASNITQKWLSGTGGLTGQLLSYLSTVLGFGVSEPTTIPLSLVPVSKVSGNLSVDVVVVAFTVDVNPDIFASECFLQVSSNKDVLDCLPPDQWKSMVTMSQSLDLVIYPVAEAPRLIVTPAELSIAENNAVAVKVTNWTISDIDGSEEMYLRLRCENTAWRKVSVDGMVVHLVNDGNTSNTSSIEEAGIVSLTTFELLPLAVYQPDGRADLSVQLMPPMYFSGSVDCTLVAHAIDRSGAVVSEDTYETPLSVTVIAEATVPLVSIATTTFSAVEDGVVVCDAVVASLVDADGSEALFLVVELGEYEQYVTSITWRSDVAVVAFSTKADGTVPALVFADQASHAVAAGAGRVEMRGSVEIGLVAGYSGELHVSLSSVSIETAYLTSDEAVDGAVARASPIGLDVTVAPVADMPLLNATIAHATPVVGTAMVVSLNKISLQDLDGSEELSVELSTSVRSDVVARHW
ncbi:unnamed protein product [Phytophthora lilii]|uniref:Unnamed protein product n=1 Tax=Phytophthora lilii TaxID=2077276 RepID=A0A9W6UBR9_9STRA|nr:unnamed protein product [Phytophthora lilii]